MVPASSERLRHGMIRFDKEHQQHAFLVSYVSWQLQRHGEASIPVEAHFAFMIPSLQ